MIKKMLLGAAAAIAISAPGVASADTNALVGVQYSNTDFDTFDFNTYGFTGAFSHDLDSGAVLQFDGRYARLDGGSGSCCTSAGYGAMHYAMRNDSHSFGGFAMLDDFFGISAIGAGIEGQMFFSNFVLNGSLGFADFSDLEATVVSTQVDGAYYVTPDFAINGLVSFSQGDDTLDADWTSFGIGGEWRFAGGPTSLTFGYRNTDFDGGDSDTWSLGLNFDLGAGSLRDRASSGPGLNGAAALHGNLHAITP